jgi:hypothetical protein
MWLAPIFRHVQPDLGSLVRFGTTSPWTASLILFGTLFLRGSLTLTGALFNIGSIEARWHAQLRLSRSPMMMLSYLDG